MQRIFAPLLLFILGLLVLCPKLAASPITLETSAGATLSGTLRSKTDEGCEIETSYGVVPLTKSTLSAASWELVQKADITGKDGRIIKSQTTTVESIIDPKTATQVPFLGQPFYHRTRKENLSKFTPEGQENPKGWINTLELNFVEGDNSPEAVVGLSNQLLSQYRANSLVLKTSRRKESIPSQTEYFIGGLLKKAEQEAPEAFKASFTRILPSQKGILTLTYTHKLSTTQEQDALHWINQYGAGTEGELMSWQEHPSAQTLLALPKP